MPRPLPQSTAARVAFYAILASDDVSPATGKTIVVTISKNGGAFGNPSAGATNATEIANGWYYVDLSTTDTATAGPLLVRGTEAAINDVALSCVVVNANRGIAQALPDAAAGAASGLLTCTSANVLPSGAIVAASFAASAINNAALAADTGLRSQNTSTAQSGSTSSTIKLSAGASSTTNAYVGTYVYLTGGTGGVLQGKRLITAYDGTSKVANITPDWTTTPDNTSTYVLLPGEMTPHSVFGAVGSVTGAVGSVTGNVGGNVSGSVGSISGVTFPSNFAALGINASGHVSRVTLTDTLTTYTGNTVQTGDAYAVANTRLPSALGANGNIKADVRDFSGTAGTFSGGRAEVNTSHVSGTLQTAGDIVDRIDSLNNLSSAQVQAAADAALAAYTAPTLAQLIAALATSDDATLAAIAALNNLSTAQVNAEVLDVLNVDTFALPGQEAPPGLTTLRVMLTYLYKFLRNKADQSDDEQRIYADNGVTVDHKRSVAASGTQTVLGEVGSGP